MTNQEIINADLINSIQLPNFTHKTEKEEEVCENCEAEIGQHPDDLTTDDFLGYPLCHKCAEPYIDTQTTESPYRFSKPYDPHPHS